MANFRATLGFFVMGAALWAQSDIRVYKASLTADQTVTGRLVLVADTFAFVDDERPESSFAVPKSNIERMNSENDLLTAQLKREIRDRAGSSTRVILRMQNPADAVAVQRWFEEKSGAAESAAAPAAMTFGALRKKRFRSGSNGRLIVEGDRIMFESTDDASDSRRWELKEIREIKLKNPYELEIRTFQGENYDLALTGTGMDNSQYREIVDRVTKARTAR